MLSLRTILTSGDGRDARPIQYEVLGLPSGQGALIALLSGAWKVLRIKDGRSIGSWSGDFDSPAAAMRSLEAGGFR